MKTAKNAGTQQGFILATVLVFLVVLSLAAFFSARLTRSDIQVVTNLQNEKQAFFAAEAGVDEALYRLSLRSPNCTSMGIGPGITSCTGTTFDASIAPRVVSTNFRSPVGIIVHSPVDTLNDPQSTTQILLSTAVPASSGNNLTTPSLQPASTRLSYSTLTIGWDVCPPGSSPPGCDSVPTSSTYDPFYPIRGLPVGDSARPVVKIVSTGTVRRPNGDVVASRTVTAKGIDCSPSSGPGSILTIDPSCTNGNGIAISGSASVHTASNIHSNAGSNGNGSGGTCSFSALSTGGSSTITAGGDITSAGAASGSGFTPAPKTGTGYVQDPFNSPSNVLYPPCFVPAGGSPGLSSRTTVCDSTQTVTAIGSSSHRTVSSPTTLSPGIYYGGITITGTGVTMSPGIYIMVNGGFQVTTGNTQVTGTNLLIVNVADPSCSGNNCAGSVDISAGNVGTSLTGISDASSPYNGFVVFQDRLPSPPPGPSGWPNNGSLNAQNQKQLFLQGGTTSTPFLNGIVYAPNANVLLQGNNTIRTTGSLIASAISTNGSPSLDIGGAPGGTTFCMGPLFTRLSWQDF